MKKFIKYIFVIVCMFININYINAASYSISVGNKSLSKGNSTKLTISGSDVTGRFNVTSSNSSIVSISEDRAWIENDSYSITLNAVSVGTATITVTPSGVSDSSGNKTELSSKTITITVSLPREKSSDNNLKSLTVAGYEISPEFSKDTLDYSVTVPEGTESIKLSAKANSQYAKVTGTGEISLNSESNKLLIVVTSETGKEKVYNLTVNVMDQNPVEVTVDGKKYTLVKVSKNLVKPELFEETTIKIGEFDIPAFTNKVSNYTLVGLKDEKGNIELFVYKDGKYSKYNEFVSDKLSIVFLKMDKIPTNYKKTTITINKEKIEAYKTSSNDKVLVYGINLATGKKNYYTYEKSEKTLQIFDCEQYEEVLKNEKTNEYLIYALAGCTLVSFILIILFASKSSKTKKLLNLKIADDSKKKVLEQANTEIKSKRKKGDK